MARKKFSKKEAVSEVKAMFSDNPDYVRQLLQELCQNIMEEERTEFLKAGIYERTGKRQGYRTGYKPKTLKTRVGKLELSVPRVRDSLFYPTLFEKYQRSEKALNLALMEAYIQGVSTRRMKKITEQLCGTEFSAGTISNLAKTLDEELDKFRNRDLSSSVYKYLVIDARYEHVRQGGFVVNQAVLMIAGINEDGKREILGVEIANIESEATWGDIFSRLKERGLHGVEFIVSDGHKGIREAVKKHFTGCIWQRCRVHYIRNIMGMVGRKDRKGVVKALKYIWDSEMLEEARQKVQEVVKFYEDKIPKVADKIESDIEETLNVLALPPGHRRRMSNTNMLERLSESVKQRTKVARIFPNDQSCLRLTTAVLLEIHEDWICSGQYLNMSSDAAENVEGTEKSDFCQKDFVFNPQLINA